MKFLLFSAAMLASLPFTTSAQRATWHSTTADGKTWNESTIKLYKPTGSNSILTVDDNSTGQTFRHWGTTFNELDWDAFVQLPRSVQDSMMYNMFSPDGDLRFTRGRVGMNCNDYGRSWFSCDEVAGDLELRYFNIDRDKTSIIPLIRAAQHYYPELTIWASPWSPPSWMKINNDYPVVSSKHNDANPDIDYLLFGSVDDIDEDEMKFLGERRGKFPYKLATQDYMIQDPRYLQAYANYFCRFIDEYAKENVPVDMIIYQNEAYSYTPYPGCPWTAEGTIRFNRDYLAPTLKRLHPDVKLYLGTFNTNRQDHVETVLSDSTLRASIDGLAFQWEGREIMPEIRRQYPHYHYICSESECGNGDMDWKAGEHTFFLIADNLAAGIDEWYNWNFLLPKRGTSPWGWNQNALIEFDPETRTARYTPEYYAVKHFTQAIPSGSTIVGAIGRENPDMPVVIARTPQGKYNVVAANRTDAPQHLTVTIEGRQLTATLAPHSFNTFALR